jgi:multidrug efflux pump subunit AcrB
MQRIVKWMVQNPVAANLLMLFLMVGGLVKGISLKQEVFPEIALDKVQVSVAYPGASPDEVEEGIILKIEDSITGVDGIKEIQSVAAEGLATVTAEIRSGENADLILQDVKSEVDRIVTFPDDAEKPVVAKLLNLTEVISVVIYGELPERTLREQAEVIREELLAFPQITQVELGGVRPYEISVEVPEENLRSYNLTLDDVAARLGRASLDLPGGKIKTESGEILLRTKEKRYHASEYADIITVADSDGTQVRLGDIATVKDSFEDTDLSAAFDGKPAAMVKVYRVADQKPTEISQIVNNYVTEKQAGLPNTIRMATWNDSSELLESRLNLLFNNGLSGLILVFVVLGLFLEIKLALRVMASLPIAFLGALFVLPALDVSINMMSLFGFILAIGILVDNAIVVGESIFEHRQKEKPHFQSAIDGILEVSTPVVFSVLTTVAAFVPIIYVAGTTGKFIKAIPLVVISLLMVSMTEALFILPAHLSNGKKARAKGKIIKLLNRPRMAVSSLLERLIAGPYNILIRFCLRQRYSIVAISIAILMLSVGVIRGGLLKFNFMPEVDGDIVTASLRMPPGTPATQTQAIGYMIIGKAMETVERIDKSRPAKESIFRHIYAIYGGTIASGGPEGGQSEVDSRLCDIALFLTESQQRDLAAGEITEAWRRAVGSVPGVDSLTFSANIVQLGADIDIQMAHTNYSVLSTAADRIKAVLSEYPGVRDIEDTYTRGKQELKLKLKSEARTLGVTEQDLARQIRSAFYGAEALRLQIGRNEVKVMVRYPEKDRKDLWEVEAMRIHTPDGGEIPLRRAATVEEGRGFSEINRIDRKRVINVTATVDSTMANAAEILVDLQQGILPELQTDYPGIVFDLVGEEEEQREVVASIKGGFILALFAIYALMAIPFRSYTQPLLIMIAIPFGLVGALIGHMVMGYSLSMLSLFGLVALAGVVVNNSLILIHKANAYRETGMVVGEAITKACQRRMRPILLTSLTTFFGLVPLIFETSVQAQFLIPMAISLGFGLLFSMVITLLLTPSLYMVLEDLLFFYRKSGRTKPTESTSKENLVEQINISSAGSKTQV